MGAWRLLVLLTPACFQSVVFEGGAEAPPVAPDLGAPADAGPPDAGPDPCTGPPGLLFVEPEPGTETGTVDPLFVAFDRCMGRAGSLRLEPGGFTLRASAPETMVVGARDYGEEFIEDVIGRDVFLANPECFRDLGFRLTPPVVLPPGRYEVVFDDNWFSCEGVPFDAARDPIASAWTFEVEP
ncbi:MAG: hypothetical protein AAF447_15825 [Myxococcota bacterium]